MGRKPLKRPAAVPSLKTPASSADELPLESELEGATASKPAGALPAKEGRLDWEEWGDSEAAPEITTSSTAGVAALPAEAASCEKANHCQSQRTGGKAANRKRSAAAKAAAAKAAEETAPMPRSPKPTPMRKPAQQRGASRLVPSSSDDLCTRFAKIFVAKLKAAQPAKYENAKCVAQRLGTLMHMSACTGTNIGWLAANALMQVLEGEPVDNAVACESEKPKATFYTTVTCSHPDSNKDPCVWSDVCKLCTDEAWCLVHEAQCPLPTPRSKSLMDTGFSCKLLSKLHKDCRAHGSVVPDGVGSTGETAGGMIDMMDHFTPLIVIMENVPELLNPQFVNWSWIKSKTKAIGYSSSAATRNSLNYGRRMDRLRAWCVNLYMQRLRSKTTAIRLSPLEEDMLHDAIWETMELLKIDPENAPAFVESCLAQSHPHVKAEFARQTKAKGPEEDSADWKDKHQKFVKNQGMSLKDLILMEPHKSSPWVENIFQQREKGCLAYAVNKYNRTNEERVRLGKQTVKLTTLDVYQSVDRMFYGKDDTCGNLAPGMRTYVIDRRRFMLGYEALHIQGYPSNLLDGFLKSRTEQSKKKGKSKSKRASKPGRSAPAKAAQAKASRASKTKPRMKPPSGTVHNTLWRDMAGNMYPMTVYIALYLSILANLPDIESDDSEEEDEMDLNAIAQIAKF